MKHYIAVKEVKAKPMTNNEFQVHKHGFVDMFTDSEAPGYLVEYPDGYQSWSPKEAFELSHLELDDPTKITQDTLNRFMENAVHESQQLDEKTTMVKIIPSTGFVQYEVSSCVDPKNYDHEMGVDIATGKIMNRFWPMLGFVLQWAKNGLRPVK
jgi:hypothetical protein